MITPENAPIGTKAYALGGGHWVRVESGWKWFTEGGGIYPQPGSDWTGELVEPENKEDKIGEGAVTDPASSEAMSRESAELLAFRRLWSGDAVEICTGCGSIQSIEDIKREHPNAIACCPERDMRKHRLFVEKTPSEFDDLVMAHAAELGMEERIADVIGEVLGSSAYDCTREWTAWQYRTMTASDFERIADNGERLFEIADAVICAMEAARK